MKEAADAASREKDELLESERAARTEAERASRMKDEFLATLCHELRTPLNAILGWSQLLTQRRDRRTTSSAKALRDHRAQRPRQTQIIEDLLDMSRIISGKVRLDVQRVDLADVVARRRRNRPPAADAKDIRLHTVLDPSPARSRGDPSRLQQVLWNLLTNADQVHAQGRPRAGPAANASTRTSKSASSTPAKASRRSSCPTCSTASARPTPPPPAATAAWAWGSRSSSNSSSCTAGRSAPERRARHRLDVRRVASAHRVHPGPRGIGTAPSRARGTRTALDDTCVKIDGVQRPGRDDEPDARALVKRLLEDCKAVRHQRRFSRGSNQASPAMTCPTC